MDQELRWQQRFSNFNKALEKLSQAMLLVSNKRAQIQDPGELAIITQEVVKEGIIQRFEYTHELAWNVMKDYAYYQGNSTIGGSRDATREALQLQLLENGHVWMEMIASRNSTSHTYDEDIANDIFKRISESYYPEFLKFQRIMESKLNSE
jgi:nucleotidyltransferase substrate binding protein (TIGR01987 family)